MDTFSGANAPAPPRGRLMEVPESLSLPRKAVPLGKVAANAVSRRKGAPRQSLQQAVYRLIYQFAAFRGTDISNGRNSHVFCAIDISVQTGQLLDGGEREWEKKRVAGGGRAQKNYRQNGKCNRKY